MVGENRLILLFVFIFDGAWFVWSSSQEGGDFFTKLNHGAYSSKTLIKGELKDF